jgi:hypothetical protein
MRVVQDILTGYSWVGVGILIIFLWRIAFFYEKTSKRWVGHYLVMIPGLILLGGVVTYLIVGKPLVGDSLGDILFFVGGLGVAVFGVRLQGLMTGEQS